MSALERFRKARENVRKAKARRYCKQWQQKNQEKARASRKKWRSEHPERERAVARNRRAKDPERARYMARKWSAENRERVRQNKIKLHAENPERSNLRNQKTRSGLADCYIQTILRSITGLKSLRFPPEIVEAKRKNLRALRLLKTTKEPRQCTSIN